MHYNNRVYVYINKIVCNKNNVKITDNHSVDDINFYGINDNILFKSTFYPSFDDVS